MKTLTATYNQLIKRLKEGIDFSDCDYSDLDYIEILEPSCNMNFVNALMRISKDGKIHTQQYLYDPESVMVNDFRDVFRREDKQKLIRIVQNFILKRCLNMAGNGYGYVQ